MAQTTVPADWTYRTLLLAVVASVLLASVDGGLTAAAADKQADSVKLVIDYGDGVELHYKALPFKAKMTVLDALTAAQAHKHGLTFKHRGSGAFAMLTKLNDLENEGGGPKSKNWLYQVNGKDADVSFGVRQLEAGDVVLWKFDVLQYNESAK